MHRFYRSGTAVLLLMVATAFGCMSPNSPNGVVAPSASATTAQPSPVPLPSPATAQNISGYWVMGYTAVKPEPPAGPVTDCVRKGAQIVSFSQTGTKVEGREDMYGDLPCDYSPGLIVGTNTAGQATLEYSNWSPLTKERSTSTWRLTFNAGTRHWTGTVDDRPIWLAQMACPWPLPSRTACGVSISY